VIADWLVHANSTRVLRLSLVGLTLVYFGTRLFRLTLLPIFIDEAIHIWWARAFLHGHFRGPLPDGKFLQVAVTALLLPVIPDALWATRFVSVLAGMATVLACYWIGKHLYSSQVGIVAAVLYVASPFALFYDRMGLADSLLTTFGTYSLLLAILLVQKDDQHHARLLGLSNGLAILTKLSGVVFLFVFPLVGLLLNTGATVGRFWRRGLLVYSVVALFVAPVFTVSLLPSPTTGQRYLWGAAQSDKLNLSSWWTTDVLTRLARNSQQAYEWMITYWTLPIAVLGLMAFAQAILRRDRKDLLLVSLIIFPIAIVVLSSEIWFPRYVLFTTVPLLVLVGRFIVQLGKTTQTRLAPVVASNRRVSMRQSLVGVLVVAVSLPAFHFDYSLLVDPALAPLPPAERFGYVEGWPAGYGVREAAAFLVHEAAKTEAGIVVARSWDWTPAYQGLDVYLVGKPNVQTLFVNPSDPNTRKYIQQVAGQRPGFLVLNQPRNTGEEWNLTSGQPMKRVWVYFKPGNQSRIEIYAINSFSN